MINQDDYIEEAQDAIGKRFYTLRDIPDTILLMVVWIRGYLGQLYQPSSDKPKIVRDMKGNISLKY